MKKVTEEQQELAKAIFRGCQAACAETINAIGKTTRKAQTVLKREAHNLGIDFK